MTTRTTTAVLADRPSAPRVDGVPGRVSRALIGTSNDPAAALARIALGLMILSHGMQKVFGAFGGYGFTGTMDFFTETMGIPWLFALLAVAAEFLGGLGLLLGLLGRVAAFGVGCTMVVAAVTTHLRHGFFMNWFGALPAGAEGWEFHLLAVALAGVVLIRGSGAGSVDRVLAVRTPRADAPGA